MLSEGPVPAFLHGLWEYALGGLLVAAPFLLAYEHDGAVATSVAVGLALVAHAATAAYRPALVRAVPVAAHALLDVAAAGFMVAAPFLLGFSGERGPTGVFVLFGVVHLLLVIGTGFAPRAPRAGRSDP